MLKNKIPYEIKTVKYQILQTFSYVKIMALNKILKPFNKQYYIA